MISNTKNILLLLFLGGIFTGLAVLAQSASPTERAVGGISVQDVIKLSKAGLGDDVIVQKIKDHGQPFDLSTDQLIQLKSNAVSDRVIRALMTGGESNTTGPSVASVPVAGKTAHASGIFWRRSAVKDSPEVRLEPASYTGTKSGGMLTSGMTFGMKKMKEKAVVVGPRASVRIAEATPEFWFYFDESSQGLGQSAQAAVKPDGYSLARLQASSKDREIITGQIGIIGGATSGVRQSDTIPFRAEKIGQGIYKVTVSQPLVPGEYAFLPPVSSYMGLNGGALYDFGIDQR